MTTIVKQVALKKGEKKSDDSVDSNNGISPQLMENNQEISFLVTGDAQANIGRAVDMAEIDPSSINLNNNKNNLQEKNDIISVLQRTIQELDIQL